MKYSDLIEKNSVLNSILDDLSTGPFAKDTFVFGSMVAGKDNPGDIDVVVIVPQKFQGVDEMGWPIAYDVTKLNPLLRLIRKYPLGYLDIFVKFDNALLVRSDDGRTFIKSKNTKELWKSMQSTMVAIESVGRLSN